MPPIEWKLAEVIQSHGLTPLQVEREAQRLGYKFGTNTIYRLVRGDGPRLVDRETLAAVVDALCVLTGETITTDDVMPFAKPKPAARTRQAPEPSAPPSPGSPDVPT